MSAKGRFRRRLKREAHPQSADHGPVEERYRAQLEILARLVDEFLNGDKTGEDREIGFFLTMFPFHEQGRFNYISNADKIDIRAMLKDIIARIEGRMMAEPERDQ